MAALQVTTSSLLHSHLNRREFFSPSISLSLSLSCRFENERRIKVYFPNESHNVGKPSLRSNSSLLFPAHFEYIKRERERAKLRVLLPATERFDCQRESEVNMVDTPLPPPPPSLLPTLVRKRRKNVGMETERRRRRRKK